MPRSAGDVLFQYKDGNGVRSISAADVNAYLKDISGADVTSKDFRTWGGTVRAANHLWGRNARRARRRRAHAFAKQ
jgi:DNA topoisomerase-1